MKTEPKTEHTPDAYTDNLIAMQPRLNAAAKVANAELERHEREGRETKMRSLARAKGVSL